MVKRVQWLLLLLFLLVLSSALAENRGGDLKPLEVRTLELQLLFYSPYDYFKKLAPSSFTALAGEDSPVLENELEKDLPLILITEKGFEPREIQVKVDQMVTWKNKRERLSALVLGVREISDLRSDFIRPEEYFSWSFPEPGEYTYVDGVVIGRVGHIVVK